MNRKNYTISEIVDRSEDIVNMALKKKISLRSCCRIFIFPLLVFICIMVVNI